MGDTIELVVVESDSVDALCPITSGHTYSINARMDLYCEGGTSTPTLPTQNPTDEPSNIPTTPSINPTQYPSQDPTIPTTNPTQSPTVTDCSVIEGNNTLIQRYCYFEDVYADPDNLTITSVTITNEDDNEFIYYDINYTILNYDCIDPSISFTYELVENN